jgi:hypothetical protein
VYALDLCFENVIASFGAPVVGILAERVFGYRPRTYAGTRRLQRPAGRSSGESGLRGGRRADDHLLPHVLGAVLDLPRGQTARADGGRGPAGGVGRGQEELL